MKKGPQKSLYHNFMCIGDDCKIKCHADQVDVVSWAFYSVCVRLMDEVMAVPQFLGYGCFLVCGYQWKRPPKRPYVYTGERAFVMDTHAMLSGKVCVSAVPSWFLRGPIHLACRHSLYNAPGDPEQATTPDDVDVSWRKLVSKTQMCMSQTSCKQDKRNKKIKLHLTGRLVGS